MSLGGFASLFLSSYPEVGITQINVSMVSRAYRIGDILTGTGSSDRQERIAQEFMEDEKYVRWRVA